VQLSFTGELIHWRGPSPFYFIPVPNEESHEIESISQLVTYGWGVIPVEVRVGKTTWTTSLFPKDGRYLVPVKNAARFAIGIELGESAEVTLTIDA
jgi:hypothetical protein